MPHIRITTGPVASMPGASRHDSGGVHCDDPQGIAAGFGGSVGASVGGGAAAIGSSRALGCAGATSCDAGRHAAIAIASTTNRAMHPRGYTSL